MNDYKGYISVPNYIGTEIPKLILVHFVLSSFAR
jgi:hypothetical protein